MEGQGRGQGVDVEKEQLNASESAGARPDACQAEASE